MDIHIRQLRYFMELAQCLNFTKAAMNLYIAQPALSQQIAELEKQLGVTLFVRNSRSVALTPAGEILLESCPDILERLERIHKQMLQAQAGVRGGLRIGYLDNFKEMLPPVLNAFRQQYPDISIECFVGNLREQKNMLHSGHIDISFARINYNDLKRDDPPAYQVLWQDDMCLAVHESHPFAVSGFRDYSLLENEELFLLDDSVAPYYDLMAQKICAEIGLNTKKRKAFDSTSTIMMHVNAGFGITLLPGEMIRQASKYVRFIPVKKACLDFGVLWLPNSSNASLPLFLDMLVSTFDTVPEK